MKDTTQAATFTGLIDLAAAELGGKAIATSDEFFADAQNLVMAGRGTFIEGKFTDRGKWMDGWESRRRRGPGHDWCIVELGARGSIAAFDIDTNHFLGNHPPFAAIEGVNAPHGTPLAELERLGWVPLLAQVPLRPGSQNLFVAERAGPVSHVRLNIYPDGGVARLRVFGHVLPEPADNRENRDDETRAHVPSQLVDLVAVKNGGLALACSDAFFGPMNNLILPGRAENMGGGWETKRSRRQGHDWIVLRLGARGRIQVAEVDTNHFKGNYPDSCCLEGIDAEGAQTTDLVQRSDWFRVFKPTKLSADTRHFIEGSAIEPHATVSHVRLCIFPDGGVSRLRLWGTQT